MKLKSLVILIAVFAALGVALTMTQNKQPVRKASEGLVLEIPLLPFDINDVNTLIIDTPATTQNLTLVRFDGKWAVANRSNYPADYDLVSSHLRTLANMQRGEEIRGGSEHLEEFGLTPTATNTVGAGYGVFSFYGKGGKLLGELHTGSPRLAGGSPGSMGMPSGQYVRLKDGPVQLVEETPGDLPRTPRDWLERDVLDIPNSAIAHVMRTLPDGTTFEVKQTSAGAFDVPGLGTNETMRQDGAQLLANCLQGITLIDVMSMTNELADLGFDAPEQYQAMLTNGILYTVAIGKLDPITSGRYTKITASYDAPELPPSNIVTNDAGEVTDTAKAVADQILATARHADAEDARLSKWVFMIPAGVAANLTLPRDQLIGPKNDPLAAATNQPGPVSMPQPSQM